MALLYLDGYSDRLRLCDRDVSQANSNPDVQTVTVSGGRYEGGTGLPAAFSLYDPPQGYSFVPAVKTVICGANFHGLPDPAYSNFGILFDFEDAGLIGVCASDYPAHANKMIFAWGATQRYSALDYPQDGGWHFVEVKYVADQTTGSYEVHVDGVTYMTFSGSTSYAPEVIETMYIRGMGYCNEDGTDRQPFCDLYIADDSGAYFNDFLGPDKFVRTLFPDAVGASSGWTPSGSSSNWGAASTDPPNSDTSIYNHTVNTPGTADSLNVGDLPVWVTRNVYGVQQNVRAYKSNATTRRITLFCRVSGTNYIGDSFYLTSSPRQYSMIWPVNPATNSAWTVTSFNAAQFGYQIYDPPT